MGEHCDNVRRVVLKTNKAAVLYHIVGERGIRGIKLATQKRFHNSCNSSFALKQLSSAIYSDPKSSIHSINTIIIK